MSNVVDKIREESNFEKLVESDELEVGNPILAWERWRWSIGKCATSLLLDGNERLSVGRGEAGGLRREDKRYLSRGGTRGGGS